MQTVLAVIVDLIICYFIGKLGEQRKIGFLLSFVLSLLLTPIIGLIITLLSKKK